MVPKMMTAFGLVLLAAAVAAVSAAEAPGASPDSVVQQRQQDMKAMANAAKTIDGMFKGSSAYDANAFRAAAETIGSHSGERLSSLFEKSIPAPGSTAASANIEDERQTFDKLAADLGVYASALSAAADRNPDVLSPQMRMQGGDVMMGGPLARKAVVRDISSMSAEHAFHLMLQTCTSCHARFRVRAE